MFQGLSMGHMIILLVIILVIFGPKNLPKIGQALGKGIREFKDAARGLNEEMDDTETQRREQRREIAREQTPPETVSRAPQSTATAPHDEQPPKA